MLRCQHCRWGSTAELAPRKLHSLPVRTLLPLYTLRRLTRFRSCLRRGEDIMPKMVEYLKADKGTDEESKAKGELQGALKDFDEALAKKVICALACT